LRGRGAPRGWHVERQGHAKRMSGGGNATTSRRGAPRGLAVESTRQPTRQEVQEAMAR
jgi:hypothetical protein